ncbi:hypothetical protein NQ318_023626 [Aromia moschata]|uniref:ATP-dependent DNA helicase n=1 Tax=Aromia moschata TaxID=1265417 RepID=A0AAV8YQ77_9CUCU|nr:hypothetical protein NQ318_023626 [Aromia moschata]
MNGEEPSEKEMPVQLISMFAYMLIFCDITDRLALWTEFRPHFIDDFTRRGLDEHDAAVFEAIMRVVHDENEPNRFIFLNAAAGAGTSFIFQTLITVLRGENVVTLALAPTGIAASLLKDGRTLHSRFKLPIEINETSTTGITPRSSDGRLIRSVKLIVIDEV